MATKQITTWDEFKTALEENITEDTTYEIMNDIDVSDTLQTNQITCATGGYRKVINGNDHKINGITSYVQQTTSGLIYANGGSSSSPVYYTFNNVHFTNFMLSSWGLFSVYARYYQFTFRNCYFNGVAYTPFGQSYDYPPTFKKCSFNIKAAQWGGGEYTNCYLTVDTLADSFEWRRGISFTDCYVKGTIKGLTTSYLMPSSVNSVFNADIKLSSTSTTSINFVRNAPGSDTNCCLYNADREYLNGANRALTINTQNYIHGLTDSQLKSKTYIQQNTNFPLYG